jgi:ATP-dependent DNA helicase RecG
MFKRHLIFELDDLPIIAPRRIVMKMPRRCFLMPDFDPIEPDRVLMTMSGGVVDLTYCRFLIQSTDFSLDDVMALDQAQNGAFYFKLLMDYLEKFQEASRADIDKLLLGKLSDALNEAQKSNKINNLLTKWRRAGWIVNIGSDKVSRWVSAEKMQR